MFKVFNQFTGQYEDTLTLDATKTRFNELLAQNAELQVTETVLPESSQVWATDLALAEITYTSFFNNNVQGKYYYTIFDVTNGVQKGRCFYFMNENGDDTLVKIDGTTVVEIYHRLHGTNKSISYDLVTKQPMFYYTDNSLIKYDYTTNAVLATTVAGSTDIPSDISLLLMNYPNITNIMAHAQKDYGYVVEYVEPKLTTTIPTDTNVRVSVIYELTQDGLIKTEVVDTSTWVI